MSGREIRPQVTYALDAARVARQSAEPLGEALAEHLEALATHWQAWLSAEPTQFDRTALLLCRAVLQVQPTPGADAGSSQQKHEKGDD